MISHATWVPRRLSRGLGVLGRSRSGVVRERANLRGRHGVPPLTRYCFGRQEMNRNFDQMKLSSRQSQILSERSSATRQQQQTACGMRRCLAHGRLAVAEACGLHRMHACKEEVAYTCDMRASGLRLLSAHSPCVGFGRTASSITEWATTTKKHPRDVVRVPLAVHAPRSDALAGSLSPQLDCLCRCRSSSTAWPAPRR
jgi:hypothetical protein